MTAASVPIAPDVLTGIRSGDERAFETLFRARYDSLVEEARRKLEDKDAAPKVIERAFTKVWNSREKFETPEDLEKALHDCVRDEAAREAKRRAMAHKMAGMEGAPAARHEHAHRTAATVDEAWAHVATALHAPKIDAQTAEAQAKLGRHHAAEHIGAIHREKSIKGPVIAGVALVAVVGAAFFLFERNLADSAINTAIESSQAVEQRTEVAQRGTLTLDDSTDVLLGPQTVLRVARNFPAENRAVKITGTASFTVRKYGEPAFKVKLRNALLTATGTKFDVNSYPTNPVVVVRVREGTVEVKVGKTVKTLTAGQSAVIDSSGAINDPRGREVDVALGWIEGHISIEGRPLREALPILERWYGLHLAAHDPKDLDLLVTIAVPLDSVQTAIDAVAQSTGLAFGYAGTNMILYDPKNKPRGVR